MRRRISGSESTSGGRDAFDAPEHDHSWAADWVATWGEGDEERVARWLTARRGSPVPGYSAVSTTPVAGGAVDPWEAPTDLSDLLTPIVTPPVVAAPVTRAEAPAAAPEAPAAWLIDARVALAAEVALLEEDRRRLAVTLTAERADAERVRTELALAAARVEAQIAGLEEERRRLVEQTEAAHAAADRAAAEERAARASLEAARDEADAFEATRLEEWIALDEEVAILTARRRRLRALRHRCGGRAS